ncbi:MAG: MipA/OmpV family protein [Betaproteobacteria bacterium]
MADPEEPTNSSEVRMVRSSLYVADRNTSAGLRLLAGRAVLCFACAASASTSTAQDDGQGKAAQWALGAAVRAEQDLYKGTGRETALLPVVRFENRYFLVQLPTVELKLPQFALGRSSSLDFRLMATYEDDGYKASDSAFLAGMSARNASVWAGVKATWETPLAELSAEWLRDASGNSGGRIVNLELETEFDVGTSLEISPRVGVSMLDQQYVNYYYGVRLGEASLSRPAYTGRSARNYELGVRATYAYGKQHLIILDASRTKLSQSITASPLVDRSSQAELSLVYAYRF